MLQMPEIPDAKGTEIVKRTGLILVYTVHFKIPKGLLKLYLVVSREDPLNSGKFK